MFKQTKKFNASKTRARDVSTDPQIRPLCQQPTDPRLAIRDPTHFIRTIPVLQPELSLFNIYMPVIA